MYSLFAFSGGSYQVVDQSDLPTFGNEKSINRLNKTLIYHIHTFRHAWGKKKLIRSVERIQCQ